MKNPSRFTFGSKIIFLVATFLMSQTLIAAPQKTMQCTMQGMKDTLSFVVSNKTGDMPTIDFPYPIDTIIFHQSSDTLLLVAMDHDEHSRPRVFISAQSSKKSHVYRGQFMTDFGGNQIQLDSGWVSCQPI